MPGRPALDQETPDKILQYLTLAMACWLSRRTAHTVVEAVRAELREVTRVAVVEATKGFWMAIDCIMASDQGV